MLKEGNLGRILENIEEENAEEWVPVTCPQPETPTESMEFLARSWSVSAMEFSKALCNAHDAIKPANETDPPADHQNQPSLASESPPVSPRGSDDAKEIFLLHQTLNPDFISNQRLLRNGIYKTIVKRKTMGRWMKDQKERKKQEVRAQNAQLHAAVSVAGVAAAVAALAASSASSPEKLITKNNKTCKTSSSALASAAALVASHCIEIAEDLGADHDHILSVVNSAINVRTNGDVMTLTAGAATALRGAATLKARLHKEHGGTTTVLTEENIWNIKESNISLAPTFVSKGGELLKRTRKGDFHWKQVSFNINSNWQLANHEMKQVVAKMKSKHMGGTFTKKKKCVVTGVDGDIPAWAGRETEQMAYFAIQTADRVIEFECKSKGDKQMWIEGIQHLLHLRMT